VKALSLAVLLITLAAGFTFAAGQSPQNRSASTEETIRQLERDWIDAEQSGNADRLAQLIADDWVHLGPDGSTQSKSSMLADIRSGDYKVQSVTIGPMDVKVLGPVAICQGSDTETSTFKGKDVSGRYVWTDVFARRNGRWQAVRSHLSQAK
jgi:uncharacterized protein (TIGR02246 family)